MLKLPALCLFILMSGAAAAEDHGGEVDLELVLAVDVSRSMNPTEAKLQRDGYVAAFPIPPSSAP